MENKQYPMVLAYSVLVGNAMKLSNGILIYLLAMGALLFSDTVEIKGNIVAVDTERIEREMLELVNQERATYHLPALETDDMLCHIAREHCSKMAEANVLSHYFPGWPRPEKKMMAAGRDFVANVENIAVSETPMAFFIHKAFMKSALHRINILHPQMNRSGIGVVFYGEKYYITEEFAAFIHPMPEDRAKELVEQTLIDWYKKKSQRFLKIADERNLTAKVISQQCLRGTPMRILPQEDGKVTVINLIYPYLDNIIVELKRGIGESQFQQISVGVTWGRNLSYPGGAYSISVILAE